MKLGIVQDGPVYNNLKKTLEKTYEYLRRASQEGCDLVVFGETWFSGYPIWIDVCPGVSLWDHEPVKKVWADTFRNGLSVESEEFTELQSVIREHGVYVIVGSNEAISKGVGNRTIFNTIYTFDKKGNLINHHRKLMPTFTEKLVYGLGDGNGLQSLSTSFGQLGSLICWEHWMPLARQAMHDQGEDLHIALWPMVKEMNNVAARQYAFEGRCHVVSVGQIMHRDEMPADLDIDKKYAETKFVLSGGSSIYGPNGKAILESSYNERSFIVMELDLDKNLEESMNLAVSGHYQRPDVFTLNINKERP